MADDRTQPRVLEGRLDVWSEEGGHSTPYVAVDQRPLHEELERMTGLTEFELERLKGDERPLVRITIEILDPATVPEQE